MSKTLDKMQLLKDLEGRYLSLADRSYSKECIYRSSELYTLIATIKDGKYDTKRTPKQGTE